jgi:hypothetical protein
VGRGFTPALWHEAAQKELPPGDYVQRGVSFLDAAVEPSIEGAWRHHERCRKGQLWDEHPSLVAVGSENDDGGFAFLEKALKCYSDYGPASLNLMLDHFRQAGRDAQADGVAARGRAFQENVSSHVRFTNRLSARERLVAHDLQGRRLRELWSVLNRFPQVGEAFLAKRSAAVLKDKPVYVLALGPRSVAVRLERRVLRAIQASMPVPCTVVLLSWWKRGLRQRMMAVCPEAVFQG